jgi:hypothetical protein
VTVITARIPKKTKILIAAASRIIATKGASSGAPFPAPSSAPVKNAARALLAAARDYRRVATGA